MSKGDNSLLAPMESFSNNDEIRKGGEMLDTAHRVYGGEDRSMIHARLSIASKLFLRDIADPFNNIKGTADRSCYSMGGLYYMMV